MLVSPTTEGLPAADFNGSQITMGKVAGFTDVATVKGTVEMFESECVMSITVFLGVSSFKVWIVFKRGDPLTGVRDFVADTGVFCRVFGAEDLVGVVVSTPERALEVDSLLTVVFSFGSIEILETFTKASKVFFCTGFPFPVLSALDEDAGFLLVYIENPTFEIK